MAPRDLSELVTEAGHELAAFIEKAFDMKLEDLERESLFSEEETQRKHYEEFLYAAKVLIPDFKPKAFANYGEGWEQLVKEIQRYPNHDEWLAAWLNETKRFSLSHPETPRVSDGFNRYFAIKALAEKKFGIPREEIDTFRIQFDAAYNLLFKKKYGIEFTSYMMARESPAVK